MAAIARDFSSNIIKNTGDSLIFYLPETGKRLHYSDRRKTCHLNNIGSTLPQTVMSAIRSEII
jgi:hypothetical protein